MWVVDTSVWIEWLLDSPEGQAVARHLPLAGDWIVPTMVQYELVIWARRESITNGSPKRILAFSDELMVIDLTTEIAVKAATLSALHSLASVDAIIYATAIAQRAQLLTCDAHFKDLPDVVYITKKSH